MSESIESKLSELALLKKNWDSYNGNPIGIGAIDAARNIAIPLEGITVKPPYIVPTSDGGISLEWHLDNKEFTISLDSGGVLEGIFVYKDEGCYYESGFDTDLSHYKNTGSVPQQAEGTDSRSVK